MSAALATTAVVVPVGGAAGDAERAERARLRDAPLHVHAVRALLELRDVEVLVAAPASTAPAVARELAAGGCGAVELLRGPAGVGEAVLAVAQARPAAAVVAVHDPLCPLVPPAALAAALAAATSPHEAVAAVRPVTDSLKRVRDGLLSSAVDRDAVRVLASPVVLPRELLERVGPLLSAATTLAELVEAVRRVAAVRFAPAPALARRVEGSGGVQLLRGLDEVHERMAAARKR